MGTAPGVVTRLARRLRRAPSRLVVLAYHRVAEPSTDPHALAVTPRLFEEQLRAVAAAHELLSVDECARRLAAGTLPALAVAVTLDDGYADALSGAAPVLAAVGAPGTVFVCSGHVRAGARFAWDDPADATARPLSPEQLAELAHAPGLDIGGHTADHVRLAGLDPARLAEQVAGDRRALEAMCGRPILSFAYPWGGPGDVDARAVRAVRAAGYRCAFTTLGAAVRPWSHPHRLPRITPAPGLSGASLVDAIAEAAAR